MPKKLHVKKVYLWEASGCISYQSYCGTALAIHSDTYKYLETDLDVLKWMHLHVYGKPWLGIGRATQILVLKPLGENTVILLKIKMI